MTKRFLLASAILIAPPLQARPWTVGQVTPVYTDAHPLRAPNTAPAYAYEDADVADNFTASTWIHGTGTFVGGGGQFDAPGVGAEAKARFDCNASIASDSDPILFPGILNGNPHRHRVFGNTAVTAANFHNATYASLRAAGNSTCYGGPLNRSIYWESELMRVLGNGALVGIVPKNIVTYYEVGDLADIGTGKITDPSQSTRWPRGLEMIFGFNPSDPTDTRVGNIISALNSAAGWARYSRVGDAVGGGFRGWGCVTPAPGAGADGVIATSPNQSGGYQPWLRNTDGTPTLNCAVNSDLIAEFLSYPCWDATNLTAPDGRSHMMPYIRDNNSGKMVCPDNWAKVIQFRVKSTFKYTSQSDFTNSFWSCDIMENGKGMRMTRNGECGHADFIPAWSYGTTSAPGVFLIFSVNCDGQTITMGGVTMTGNAHECGFGRISATQQLFVNEASPDGSAPNPIVNLNPDQTGAKQFDAPIGTPIPGVIHNSHTSLEPSDFQTPVAGADRVSFDLASAGGDR